MFVVYILFLKQNRLYVGQTKRWRLQDRWEEHRNPNFCAARWTTKHKPISKGAVFECVTLEDAKKLEHEIVEYLMKQFGLDAVRGGRFNMPTEGEDWWVPRRLKNIPRFTLLFSRLSECNSTTFLQNVPSRFSDDPLSQLDLHVGLLSRS